MSVRKQATKGVALVSTGRAFNAIAGLLRNIIVARLIGAENMGIAATFGTVMTMLETISTVSIDRLLIQAKDGDDDRFMATSHFAQVGRGALIALAVLLLADWFAQLFSVPEAAWAYRWVAVVPLVRSFAHLDTKRMQRNLRFGPDIAIMTITQAVLLASAWPVAAWYGDYSAALYLTIGAAVIFTIASHAATDRPYRWACDAEYLKRIGRFGWPLMVNGVLLITTLQGEKFVIGASKSLFGTDFGMAALGNYDVALRVAMMPTVLIAGTSASLTLTLLARVQDDDERFAERTGLAMRMLAGISALAVVTFVCIGPLLITLMYGDKYVLAPVLIVWLGAAQAFRILRVVPVQSAMSRANTRCLMYCNGLRATAVLAVVVIAAYGGTVAQIAMAGLGGELLAVMLAVSWVPTQIGIRAAPMVRAALLTTLFTGAALGAHVVLDLAANHFLALGVWVVLVGGVFAAFLGSYPQLRAHLKGSIDDFRTGRGAIQGGGTP